MSGSSERIKRLMRDAQALQARIDAEAVAKRQQAKPASEVLGNNRRRSSGGTAGQAQNPELTAPLQCAAARAAAAGDSAGAARAARDAKALNQAYGEAIDAASRGNSSKARAAQRKAKQILRRYSGKSCRGRR